MRILPRSEIEQRKNEQLRQAAEEGLKLARRVDSLRELQATTEAQLDKFAEQTLAAQRRQIEAKQKEYDDLVAKTSELRQKYDSMLPGMEVERKELDERRKKIEAEELRQQDARDQLLVRDSELSILEKQGANAVARALSQEQRSLELHNEANRDREEASTMLARAAAFEEKVNHEHEDAEKLLAAREESILEHETMIREGEIALGRERKEVADEKVRLADQRQTLERAMARLKQNGLA